jgi:hypothetical protein
MKSVRHTLFSGRNIPGIFIKVNASPVFISLMRNYVLTSILSMMVTLMIADSRQPGELCEDGYVRTV